MEYIYSEMNYSHDYEIKVLIRKYMSHHVKLFFTVKNNTEINDDNIVYVLS